MVVGGYPPEANSKSEIYDLSGQNLNCPSIINFPNNYGSFGTFISNKTMVCGGNNPYTSDCYSYNIQVNT